MHVSQYLSFAFTNDEAMETGIQIKVYPKEYKI